MGWNRVRKRYGIELPMQVRNGVILIGEPDSFPLLTISSRGAIVKRYHGVAHTELLRAQQEMDEGPEELRALVSEPDHFGCSQTVYVVDGWTVSEHQCEKPGWPHTTHDGVLMRPGQFETSLERAISLAIHAATRQKLLEDQGACTARQQLLCHEARGASILRDLHALQWRLSTVAEVQSDA